MPPFIWSAMKIKAHCRLNYRQIGNLSVVICNQLIRHRFRNGIFGIFSDISNVFSSENLFSNNLSFKDRHFSESTSFNWVLIEKQISCVLSTFCWIQESFQLPLDLPEASVKATSLRKTYKQKQGGRLEKQQQILINIASFASHGNNTS